MLFFLVGPLIFFSDMRYIAQENPIKAAKISVSLSILDQTIFPIEKYESTLFYTNNPISLTTMDKESFKNKSYN
jgi:hypothetical protein